MHSETLKFLDRFSKSPQMSDLMKIHPVGAELFHADGRTDRQTGNYYLANSRFSQFCECAKKRKKNWSGRIYLGATRGS